MAEKVWVFAYGSLMWRPDFPYLEMRPARLFGYHRALCIYSVRARGTDEVPGLVLGLDRGGSCVGRAYSVAPENWEEVRAYLIDREMGTGVYTPTFLRLVLDGGERVTAYCFVARRDHVQYTGRLPDGRMVELLLQGVGQHGSATEYLANTVAHLDELGITAGPLHRILEKALATQAAG
ncbi:MAG: gamma-glutamylcyclotransferase [Rhodospirillales bacterium]|jgi:glutathione-specific gamma-glutamylcyclotransferase|nr:gamma-glutamylcyclotransferase [Rhodospirillales bacterium]